MNMERAGTLEEGKQYWLAGVPDPRGLPLFSRVIFIGYTACPAIVVVQDEQGERLRCSRKDLYTEAGQTNSGCMAALSARACMASAEGLD